MPAFRRKYNTTLSAGTTAIRIPVIKRGVVDYATDSDWTPATGDVKVLIDNAAAANITNLPTAISAGGTKVWEFILTASELSCKQLEVVICDLSGAGTGTLDKVIEDQMFIVETFGHPSAMWPGDLSQGTGIVPSRVGTAQGGGLTTITLDASASSVNEFFRGQLVVITGGTGAGQGRMITTYVGSSKVAHIHRQWATNPDNTSTFSIYPVDAPKVNGQLQVVATNDRVVIYSGTAQSGSTTNTIKLDTGASSTNDIYVGNLITLTGGVGAGQARNIIDYDGSTKVATVDRNWVTTPDNTTTFEISANVTNTPFSDQGVAQAGASGSITLASTASSTNNIYNGSFVTILSGTGAGQTREITAYNGTTKVATVGTNWTTPPDNTSGYAVLPLASMVGGGTDVNVVSWSGLPVSNDGTYPKITVSSYQSGQSPMLPARVGTCQSGSTTANIILDSGASAVNNFYRGEVVVLTGGTGAGQSRVIASYTGSSKVAVVDRVWITAPDNTTTFAVFPLSEPALNSTLQVSASNTRVVIRSGTAQAGSTTNTIKLDSGASSTNNVYVGNLVSLTAGTGIGQSRNIIAYNGTTKVATVDRNWVVTPDNTTGFDIYANTTVSPFSDQGIAQAGGATSITLQSTASGTNSYYNGSFVTILSGTGAGQTREITAYNGTTKVATVDSAWSINPDSTSGYAVIPLSSMTGTGVTDVNVLSWAGVPVTSADGIYPDVATVTLTPEALALFFTEDTGETYASSVAGSVVQEIADNASGGGGGITAADVWDLADGIETGITPRLALRYLSSVLCGLNTGAGTGTETYKAINNSGTSRLIYSINTQGNRTGITLG